MNENTKYLKNLSNIINSKFKKCYEAYLEKRD